MANRHVRKHFITITRKLNYFYQRRKFAARIFQWYYSSIFWSRRLAFFSSIFLYVRVGIIENFGPAPLPPSQMHCVRAPRDFLCSAGFWLLNHILRVYICVLEQKSDAVIKNIA